MGPIKVKKPKAILFDLSGTATKSYYTDKILFPYIKLNCATYLHNNWKNEVLQRDIQRLREQSKKDKGPVIAPSDADKSKIEDSVCKYVFRSLEDLRENDAINIFRLHMWFDGYQRDKIETPVYSDVAIQIKHWRINQNIKLYVLSNGWIEATKRFMAKTNHGDLNLLIDGHFDTTMGPLNKPETFRKVVEKINLPADQVLFLTKSFEECKAAREAGLNTILVCTHRRDLNRLEESQKQNFVVVRSFNEITFVDDGTGIESNASAASSAASSASGSKKSSSSSAVPRGPSASGSSKTKSKPKSKSKSKSGKSKGAPSGISSKGSSASSSKGSSASSSKGSSASGASSSKGSSKSGASSSKGSSSASSSKGSSSSGASSSKGSSSASSSKGSSSASSSKGSSSSGASSSKGSSSASSSKGSSSSGASSSKGSSSSSGASSSKGSSSSSGASSSKGSSSASGASSSKGSSSSGASSSKGSSSSGASSSKGSSKSSASSSKGSSSASGASSSKGSSKSGASSSKGSKSK